MYAQLLNELNNNKAHKFVLSDRYPIDFCGPVHSKRSRLWLLPSRS